MTGANLVSYGAQIAALVTLCAALPRVLALRSPVLQYGFWRALLLLCLVLPIVEPWQHKEVAAVPALSSAAQQPAGALVVASPAPTGRGVNIESFLIAIEAMLLCGMAARLAWLGAGCLRLKRLRRRATVPTTTFDDLCETIGASASIHWSADVRHPVTFGIARPIVLLPLALASAEAPAQRAVVAHELHHVSRRDWAWVVAEEIVRSVFWFHPAIWWLVSRVQLARETVVDELSILTTNARRAYLDALLACADDTSLVSTAAFSARRHLFHRVMFLSKEGNMSSSKVAFASAVLVAALGAGSWTVVRAFPLASTVVMPEIQQTKTAVAPQRPSASQPLARSMPLLPPSRGLSRSADQYVPPPPPPPPPPAMTTADAQAPEPPMPAEFKVVLDRLQPVRLGKRITPPAAKKSVKAAYPDDARAARIQGEVEVETIVDGDGKVAAVRVIRSVPGLDEAATAAVNQWEFTPALLNGTPTPVLMKMVMTFTLK